MKLVISKLFYGELEEKVVITNIRRITHCKHYNEDGSKGIIFLYWLKDKKYSIFDSDEYILPKGYSYHIEED